MLQVWTHKHCINLIPLHSNKYYQPNDPSLQTVPNTSTVQITPFTVVATQNHTVPFVAMNKSVKSYDGLDHQYAPDEYLQQIDTHNYFLPWENNHLRVL